MTFGQVSDVVRVALIYYAKYSYSSKDNGLRNLPKDGKPVSPFYC